MDTITQQHSDKENFELSSQSTVSYPELPLLSPLRTKRPPARNANASPPEKHHVHFGELIAQSTNFSASPANTSRRRAAARVAGLTGTPPRTSHAEKIKRIFHNSTTAPFGEPRAGTTSCSSGSSDAISDLEPDLRRKLNVLAERALHPVGESHALPAATGPQVTAVPPQCLTPSAPPPTPNQSDGTSTDSWTGDDEFFPRSVARSGIEGSAHRHTISSEHKVRDRPNSAKKISPAPSSMAARQTGEVRLHLESTGVSPRRGSRFRVVERPNMAGAECLISSKLKEEELVNDRPSDADDEDESDEVDC